MAAIFWNSKYLLAKTEVTYGVDAAPTPAANAILAKDVGFNPMEGVDIDRALERPYFGGQATTPAELHAKLSFKVELAPSGAAGTPPAWGPLLRACGVAQTINAGTSVVYNPITLNPDSLTIHFWYGNTRHVLLGARGTFKLTIGAQQIPYLEFVFTGLWQQASEQVRGNPTFTQLAPQAGSTANTPTFTINGVAQIMRSFMLDVKNAVEGRFLIGAEAILITGRGESIECTVEATQLTTFNPFALANAQTLMPINLVHGTGAGKIATLAVPLAQMQRPQGLTPAQDIVEWPLRMAPIPNLGNDQWTLTLT
jgi:hypothetical protein